MGTSKNQELDRKYRVLRQTLGIHSILRDKFALRAKLVESILLVCSVIFCATTFANDELYQTLGIDAARGKVVLGITSVAAFAAALILLFVDWKGRSEKHWQGAERWSKVLALYRDAWHSDGTWETEKVDQLNKAYWDADEHTVPLPSGCAFSSLKSKFLLGVEISKLKSRYPGCPKLILGLIIRFAGTYKAIRDSAAKDEGARNEHLPDANQDDVAG